MNAGCGGGGGGGGGNCMTNGPGVTGPPNDETEAAGDEKAGVGGTGAAGGDFALEPDVLLDCLEGCRAPCEREEGKDAKICGLLPDPSTDDERTLASSVDTVEMESRPRRVRLLFPFQELWFSSACTLQADSVFDRPSVIRMKSKSSLWASLLDRILSTICLVFDLRKPDSSSAKIIRQLERLEDGLGFPSWSLL